MVSIEFWIWYEGNFDLYTIIPLYLWLTSSYSFWFFCCFILCLCDTFFSLTHFIKWTPIHLDLKDANKLHTLIQILELAYSIKCACNPLSSVGLLTHGPKSLLTYIVMLQCRGCWIILQIKLLEIGDFWVLFITHPLSWYVVFCKGD